MCNKVINIIIMGETGAGKSTWINALANYLTYPALDEAKLHPPLSLFTTSFIMTDNNYQRRRLNYGHDSNKDFNTEQSATQEPKTYLVNFKNILIQLIVTPGIGDTRGVEKDKKNFDAILRYLTNLDKLHGICILLKPINAQLGVIFRFCIKELLTHLHRDASRNIVFCFTNAKSTFYRPGVNMPALETLLNEYKNFGIKLSKETIYCMDNEAFRFLCALHNGIEFDEKEYNNYSESWQESVVETNRMFDYICGLYPHNVSKTLSLNDIRNIIISLSKPMADIKQNIVNSINDNEDKKKAIINSNESEKYFNKDNQALSQDIVLQIKNLEQLISELNEEKDSISNISVKFVAFLKTNSIVPYNDALGEYLDILIRMEKDKVSAGGDRKTLDGLEQCRKEYNEEVKLDVKLLEELEKMRKDYNKDRVLDKFVKTDGKEVQLTRIDVIGLVNELYSLKHKGNEFKQIIQDVPELKLHRSDNIKSFNYIRKVGSGYFGEVWEAKDVMQNKSYAIKKIKVTSDDLNKYVKREIEILSTLNENYAVKLIGSWIDNNYKTDKYPNAYPFLVHIQMEFCQLTLQDITYDLINPEQKNKNSKVSAFKSPQELFVTMYDEDGKLLNCVGFFIASQLFIEILDAVNYLHNCKPQIIHRNLKTTNILITNNGTNKFVKLAGFSLATLHESDEIPHTPGVGTYTCPELMFGHYNTLLDIYSLHYVVSELFNINVFSEINKSSALFCNYSQLQNLIIKMSEAVDKRRPNCAQILENKHLWCLTYQEANKNSNFSIILKQKHTKYDLINNFIPTFIHTKSHEIEVFNTKLSSEHSKYLKFDNNNSKLTNSNADKYIINKHELDLYETKMNSCFISNPDDELKKGQTISENECIKFISEDENVRKDVFINLLQYLLETIIHWFLIYQNKNTDRIKLEEKTLSTFKEACDLYERKIHLYVELCPNEAELKNIHIIAVEESIKYFSDKINQTIQFERFDNFLESLRVTIPKKNQIFRNKNMDPIIEKEKNIQTTLTYACNLYERKIQSSVESNPNDNALKNIHKFAEKESIKYVSDKLINEVLNENFMKIIETLRITIGKSFEYYRNKNLVRIKEQKNFMIIPCVARSKTQKIKPEVGYQKSKNIVDLELPCPGHLNEGCDQVDQCWFCGECKKLIEYGFDDYFYCKCGRADVYSFEFKCNSKNHSTEYFQFNISHLKKLLSNKEFNILILGETGVGKSTWINGFVNYITFPSLAEAKHNELLSLIPSSFTITDNNYRIREITCGEDPNEILKIGQSVTQNPKAYVFNCENKLIRIIDTPGIGDTRGINQDKQNFDAVLRYIWTLEKLHGICIFLKPNNARLGVMFRFCIKELLTHLHRDASRNIVFCFTNARSTFYRPGDTLPALQMLLQENKDVDIPLKRETLYIMDNEPFRFLCALHNGIEFDEKEFTNYSESWDKTVVETKRMLDYICGLTPHFVSNTMSINDTRKVIISLSKPMVDITQNILTNINVVEDKKIEILKSEKSVEGLKNRLYMEVIQLEATQLGYPRTVCNDQKCVTFHNIDGSSQYTTEFTTHCHPKCTLTGVKPELYPNPEIRKCSAMAKTDYCQKCGCSWEKHMHITYEQKQVKKKVIDETVEMLLKDKQTLRKAVELQIQNMEEFVRALNEEKDMITTISAKFGRFLKANSIVPYNDAIGEYINVLIRMEKDKVSAGGDRKTLDGLEKMKQDYIEQDRVLEQFMTSDGKTEQLTPFDVIGLVDKLYALKHKGNELKQIMQVVSSSKSQMQKFQETSYTSRFKKSFDYIGRKLNWDNN